MTSNIIMRPYHADGIPAVLQLWKDAEAVPGPTDNATAIEIRLQRDAELFVLATHGEGIVGSLLAVGTAGVATWRDWPSILDIVAAALHVSSWLRSKPGRKTSGVATSPALFS